MTAKGKSGVRQGGPRRWPDVMIGVLVLALLGGFGTLLAGQRKKVEAAPTPQTPSASTAVIPASPGTVQEEPTPAPAAETPSASTPSTASTPATPPAASTPPAAAQTTPTTPTATPQTSTPAATPSQAETPATNTPATNSNTTATATEIPPVPAAPPVAPIKPPVVPQTQTQTQSQSPEAQTTPTPNAQTTQTPAETPAVTTPRVAPRSGGAVATSENRTPLRSDYRISLGSFATRRTVDTQTSGVAALGYNVHPIDLGDQYVAQVGPFADEATARQALADIQRAYPGALLYRPRNQTAASTDNASTASSNTSTSTASSSSNETAASATATRAPAPSGPTYLQVGAFDRVESAQNLVSTLRDIDFAPTVNNPPDKKTTVLVGPYSGDALLRAEARLDNAGLDHFRVR